MRTRMSRFSPFPAKKEPVWQSTRAWFAQRFHVSWDDRLSNAAQEGRATLSDCQTGFFWQGRAYSAAGWVLKGKRGFGERAKSTLSKGEGESTLPE